MIKPFIIVGVLSVLCLGHKFRFDYEYSQQADGWLKLHIVPGTWREARMRCHAEGAVLASPLTEQLKKAIIEFVVKKKGVYTIPMFIGVHATFSKGDYTSIEGVPLARLPIDWAPDEPDNYENGQSCLAMTMHPMGLVADMSCEDTLPYVCYKKYAKLNLTDCGTTDHAYKLEPRTGSCYKFHRRGLVWQQAFMTCLAEGGHLAIINSELESKVIKEITEQNPDGTIRSTDRGVIAVGFHDWGEHMTYLTIHGETLDQAGFQTWAGGQPDNATRPRIGDTGEFCGSVFRNGLLNDIWCNIPIPFICEKSRDSLLSFKPEAFQN